jgi:uncharacterized protein (DUF302 family)
VGNASEMGEQEMQKTLYMIALLFAGFGAVTPAAAIDGLVTKPSKYSVAESMDRLDVAIKEFGATVFARIDLKAAAQKGELLRPHQIIIFGRGGALQPFLAAASTSGIDLPQKILVFEDPEGKVWVMYNTAEYVAHRHGISNVNGIAEIVAAVNRAVSSFADKVVQ